MFYTGVFCFFVLVIVLLFSFGTDEQVANKALDRNSYTDIQMTRKPRMKEITFGASEEVVSGHLNISVTVTIQCFLSYLFICSKTEQ
jgi:hypothetical protein